MASVPISAPVQRVLAALSERNRLVQRAGESWKALCPTHDDRKQSLAVGQGSDGRALVKCHADCRNEDVVTALGLTMRDLFVGNVQPRPLGEPIATYDYSDAKGELVYQACRFEPKDFRQRRPDGQGGWLWKIPPETPRYLYRLPDLRKKKGRTVVFLVEGEKDVDRLWGMKLPATTNLGGAGKWRPEYTEQLTVAGYTKAVLLPDNDEPGRKHMAQVAAALHAAGFTVKVVTLPGLPGKGDVSDWLESGHSKEDLFTAIAAAPEWSPEASTAPATVTKQDAVTKLEDVTLDLTAERLIEPVPFPESARVGLPHDFATLYEGRSDAPYPYLYMSYLTCAAAAMSPYVTVGSRYNPGRVGLYTVKIGPSAVGRKSFSRGEALAHFEGLPNGWGKHLYIPDSDPGSDVGLIRLARHAMQDDEGAMVRPMMLTPDEFTVLTKKISIQGSTFVEILNRLFDLTTAGATSKQFDRQVTAHLSILSGTTDQLWTAGLGVESLDIGFLNRLFLVPAYRTVELDAPTDPDFYAMQDLQGRTMRTLTWAADRALAPVRFVLDEPGQAIFSAWQGRMKALRVDGVKASYLDVSNRLDVYLRRLAAVLTVLGWAERPAPSEQGYPFDPAALSVACDLASWQFQARWNAQPVTGENPWAVHESILREYLRKHLKAGQRVERRQVAQRFKRWGSKGVDMAIVGLERNGELVAVPEDRGHGGKGYVTLSPEGLYPAG